VIIPKTCNFSVWIRYYNGSHDNAIQL